MSITSNTRTRNDLASISARAGELRTKLQIATERSAALQLEAWDDDKKQPEADTAFAEVESLKRQLEIHRGVYAAAERRQHEEERKNTIEVRKQAVEAARPVVDEWIEAARAFAEHLHDIREKIEAMEAARAALQSAIPYHGAGGAFTPDEYASIRSATNFDRREILKIGGTVYHSKLGEMGAFPDMDRFAPALDIRERVEGMREQIDAVLDRLAART